MIEEIVAFRQKNISVREMVYNKYCNRTLYEHDVTKFFDSSDRALDVHCNLYLNRSKKDCNHVHLSCHNILN